MHINVKVLITFPAVWNLSLNEVPNALGVIPSYFNRPKVLEGWGYYPLCGVWCTIYTPTIL